MRLGGMGLFPLGRGFLETWTRSPSLIKRSPVQESTCMSTEITKLQFDRGEGGFPFFWAGNEPEKRIQCIHLRHFDCTCVGLKVHKLPNCLDCSLINMCILDCGRPPELFTPLCGSIGLWWMYTKYESIAVYWDKQKICYSLYYTASVHIYLLCIYTSSNIQIHLQVTT